MPQTLEGTCPGLVLDNGCKVVVEALDPTSGNAVAGVKVSNVNIYGEDLTPDAVPGLLPPVVLLPAGEEGVLGAVVGATVGAGLGG